MKRIVITGARGYIGSALTKRLAREDYALRLVSRSRNEAAVDAGASAEMITADLREEADWRSLLADTDAVVHLSSRTDLRAAEADPQGDDNLNVEPVRALVRAAAGASRPKVVVFASAVTIVGEKPDSPVDERTPNCPCSIYDRHKLACENILREATARGVLRACTLRLSNVYGFGTASINSNRGILNAMMKRAAAGEPLTLYGEGAYLRDFVHIDDVAEAFCAAIATDRVHDGRSYVIASGESHSLAEAFAMVAEEAFQIGGRRVDIQRALEPADLHPIERRNFVGNSQLFRVLTGWQPRFDLKAGIRDYFTRAGAHPATAVGAKRPAPLH